MRKAPFLTLSGSRKRPQDAAGLRAHSAQQVESGQATQAAERLLNFVESLAERCDRLCWGELVMGNGPERVLDEAMRRPGLLAEVVV